MIDRGCHRISLQRKTSSKINIIMKNLLLLLTLAFASITASAQKFRVDGLAIVEGESFTTVEILTEVELLSDGLVIRHDGVYIQITLDDNKSDSSYVTQSGKPIYVYDASDGVKACRVHRMDYDGGIGLAIEQGDTYLLFDLPVSAIINPEGV